MPTRQKEAAVLSTQPLRIYVLHHTHICSHRTEHACASHRAVVMAVAKSWKKLSAARLPNTRCFLYCLTGSQVARTSRLSRPLSPTGACFVPPIAQWSWPSRNRGRNCLSVPRRLGNPVADRGHHVTPGGRGFGRSGEAAKCPLTDPVKSP